MKIRNASAIVLALCAGAAHGQTFTYAGSPIPIPDAGGGPITADIVVGAPGTVTNVEVDVYITHTFQGDLRMLLTHVETGTTVTLVDRPGSPPGFGFGNDNYGTGAAFFSLTDAGATTYDTPQVAAPGIPDVTGDWRAEGGALSVLFDGQTLAGTWRLTVEDFAGADLGTFQTFRVRFNGGAPVFGRCCLPNGTCAVITQSSCTGQGGVYGGDNTNCSTACPMPPNTWIEQGDAGDLPGTAQVTSGPSPTTALNEIRGSIGAGDSDMYRINICNPANFSATTVGGATIDTQLFLFNTSGGGIAFNDDAPAGTLQSALSSTFTASLTAGAFNLAVSTFDRDPTAGGLEMWIDTPYNVERAPDGAGAAGNADAWIGTGSSGSYTVALTGSCFAAGSGCYANCDGSTTAPILNVADFTCFLQQFAAGNSYANCDGSTQAPVLNVADFTCFLQRFAAGCP